MAKIRETVQRENEVIQEAFDEVQSLVNQYQTINKKNTGIDSIESSGEVSRMKLALVRRINGLFQVTKGPVDMVFNHFENVSHSGAVRALLEIGVFQQIPTGNGSKSATELAAELGVDKKLLVRLMRLATTLGPFKEVAFEEYAHTPYSEAYLRVELRRVIQVELRRYAVPELRLCDFFQKNGWTTPTSTTNNPYTFAHHIGGKDMWDHMKTLPEREKTFNEAMAAQCRESSWIVGIFPFEKELSKIGTDDDTPLVVDIGGRIGHDMRQIKKLCPSIKGRMILEDGPEIIAEVGDLPPGIEKIGYCFFTPQPVKGALFYTIRRCLHNWSDETCITILKIIAAAMIPNKSRLVIGEIVLPDTDSAIETSWLDLAMMVLGGMERTKSQWISLLDASGLELRQIHTSPGTANAAIEAWLK
ncbi:O-methyltransferase [Cadophora sp. DSE1049]|nr:O-methyltransferase [Cadophora sp. DSE1049]